MVMIKSIKLDFNENGIFGEYGIKFEVSFTNYPDYVNIKNKLIEIADEILNKYVKDSKGID